MRKWNMQTCCFRISALLTRLQRWVTPESDSWSDVVLNTSLKQLKRVLFEYLSRNQSKDYSVWMNTGVMHVFDSTVREMETDQTRRFYLSLCIIYRKETVISYPIFAEVAKGSLSVASSTGCITNAEAQATLEEITSQTRHHEKAELTNSAILDFERALFANDEIRTNELAQQVEMLTMLTDAVP